MAKNNKTTNTILPCSAPILFPCLNIPSPEIITGEGQVTHKRLTQEMLGVCFCSFSQMKYFLNKMSHSLIPGDWAWLYKLSKNKMVVKYLPVLYITICVPLSHVFYLAMAGWRLHEQFIWFYTVVTHDCNNLPIQYVNETPRSSKLTKSLLLWMNELWGMSTENLELHKQNTELKKKFLMISVWCFG